MLKLGGFRHDACLPGSPEDLLKVQTLPLVGDVENLIGVEVLHPLNHGGEVRGGVDGGAIGLHQNAGGHFLLVRVLGHGDDPSALALHRQAPVFQILYHGGNVGVSIGLTQPALKGDAQIFVVLLQVRHGNVHDMLPQSPVAPAALLEFKGGGVGLLGKGFILFFPGGGGGVDLLQLGNGEGGLLRVFPGVIRVEVGKLRLPPLQFRDDQAHLQTPVAQVNVADGIIAEEFVQPFQALADDGGAQMTDVQGLGHIGSAVIHHNGLPCPGFHHAEIFVGPHLLQVSL